MMSRDVMLLIYDNWVVWDYTKMNTKIKIH